MAGPWEAFQSGSSPSPVTEGPWSSYRPVAPAEATPADTRPDRGALDAAARGAAQGFTANFSDEMRGLVEAGGANPDDPASLSKLLTGALKYWTGDQDAKKRYDEAVKRERELNKTAEDQHGVASTVGALGGALALPIGVGAQAATLPGRMAAGAATGAAFGGVAGVGSGEGAADSLARGAIGAAGGGILGAAAPAVIEGAIQGGRAIATPVANAVRGIRDPEGEAARRVAVALERDTAADPGAVSRLTPAELAASNQSGGPAMVMDLGGETTRGLARSAANTSPEGRGVLNRAIDDRFEGQTDRVNTWLRDTFHYPDADAQQQAIEQVSKNINRPAYAKAYQDGNREIMTPGMQDLLGSPAVVDAMQKAARSGKDRAITQGYGAFNPGVTVENGVVNFRKGQSGAPTYPNLAFWDATKRELDDAAKAAARRGETGQAGVLGDLAKKLRGELDTEVSSYAGARAGAAQFFGAENALEAGQKFVTQNFAASETRRALSKMSPQERQLFQDGFVSRFIDTLNQVGDRRTIVNKIAESPAAREKLRIALGPQKADQLEAGLRVEGIMDLARSAVQGNSTTARQLAELGLAGGAGALGNGLDFNTVHPSALMTAALVYGAARGKGRINENVARQVANLLTSRDPAVVSRGMRMVANNQTLLGSLRAADQGLARIGSSEAPSLPFVPAMNPSRADNQPDANRPSGQ
jgi:hypothetical protein